MKRTLADLFMIPGSSGDNFFSGTALLCKHCNKIIGVVNKLNVPDISLFVEQLNHSCTPSPQGQEPSAKSPTHEVGPTLPATEYIGPCDIALTRFVNSLRSADTGDKPPVDFLTKLLKLLGEYHLIAVSFEASTPRKEKDASLEGYLKTPSEEVPQTGSEDAGFSTELKLKRRSETDWRLYHLRNLRKECEVVLASRIDLPLDTLKCIHKLMALLP